MNDKWIHQGATLKLVTGLVVCLFVAGCYQSLGTEQICPPLTPECAYQDHDGDGVANGEDDFPFDAACSEFGDTNCGACGRGCAAGLHCTADARCTRQALSVAAGESHTCAVVDSGSVFCWGGKSQNLLGTDVDEWEYVVPVAVADLERATRVWVARSHSCALLTDGTARCWGDDDDGQLGDGSEVVGFGSVVTVRGLSDARKLALGDEHSCALRNSGTVECWGANYALTCGQPEYYAELWEPVPVKDLAGAIDVAAGYSHTCAVLTDGTARCWGDGEFVPLGNGHQVQTHVPQTVAEVHDAVAIAAGELHTCALLGTGKIQCWGKGYVGDGVHEDFPSPVFVAGIDNAVAIAAGDNHSCAVLADGTARCWGDNSYGQLGDGTRNTRLAPVQVIGLNNAVAIASGTRHNCALLADGQLRCWGNNTHGQLGDGTDDTPVGVVEPVGF